MRLTKDFTFSVNWLSKCIHCMEAYRSCFTATLKTFIYDDNDDMDLQTKTDSYCGHMLYRLNRHYCNNTDKGCHSTT